MADDDPMNELYWKFANKADRDMAEAKVTANMLIPAGSATQCWGCKVGELYLKRPYKESLRDGVLDIVDTVDEATAYS